MKKIVISFMLIVVLLTSCTNPFCTIRYEGVFETENYENNNPKISIVLVKGEGRFLGELEKDDGTKTKIVMKATKGIFVIYEVLETGTRSKEYMYHGKYEQKKDTLILTAEECGEIVLKKVADIPNGYLDSVSYPERHPDNGPTQ